MATDQPQSTISLKLLVDEEKNRVVVAEADKDFVDVLFSFLTLPMGTIIRLLSTRTEPPMIGSLSSLYKGVADLDAQYFQTETHKSMLLSPRNSSEAQCRNLKLNLDDTEPPKYYACDDLNCKSQLLSIFKNIRCRCGGLIKREIDFISSKVASKVDDDEGVLVKGLAKFMVTDDLEVLPMSTDHSLLVLSNAGIRDMKALQTMEVSLGSQEVLDLLMGALFSKTSLTDVFLRKLAFNSSSRMGEFETEGSPGAPNESMPATDTLKMDVKLYTVKSSKKILYAEAGEDFVDFLFSLLAFPLGSMVKLLGSNLSLGCIDNLYRSVGSSEFVKYMKSEDCKASLLSPKIAHQFSFNTGLLNIVEDYKPTSLEYKVETMNPKSPNWKTKLGFVWETKRGFVRRPADFMVTDNLVVTPFSFVSSIDFLQGLRVQACELEKRMVRVGTEEALNLLKASLTSDPALTNAFSMLKPMHTKRPKQEN